MKIGIFSDTYYPQLNGVTTSVDNYAKELRKLGHTVYIFAPKIKGYKEKNPFVYLLPSLKLISANPDVHIPFGVSYKGMFQILKMDFDIIHAHGNGAFSLLGYEVARAEGVPYVLTFHTMFTEYTHYFFKGKVVRPGMVAKAMGFVANRCDGIIAPSEKMRKALIRFGVKKPIKVLPNFVDVSAFTTLPAKGYLHKKIGISEKAPILLSVGRIGEEKNFSFLIEAFNDFAQKEKSAHLVIVGGGKGEKELTDLIAKQDARERIHLAGEIKTKDMPRVYADAVVFVFASTTEVHPMVTLEAAAAGLPLLIVKDLAFSGIIEDGKNGYTFSLNKKIFVEKLSLLIGNTKRLVSFGSHSREIVQEKYLGATLTNDLVMYYESLLGEQKIHARVLHRVNRAAARGVRTMRHTTHVIDRFLLQK